MNRPLLVVYCGLPGVGKSTASGYTAEQLDATRYRTDEVRQSLFENPTYTPEEMQQTYDELFSRVRSELESGTDVVIDATFNQASRRERARSVADDAGASILFVRVTCPESVVIDRIKRRTDDPSDADVSVYREHRDAFEPIECDHICIDNGGTIEETHRQVDANVLSKFED